LLNTKHVSADADAQVHAGDAPLRERGGMTTEREREGERERERERDREHLWERGDRASAGRGRGV